MEAVEEFEAPEVEQKKLEAHSKLYSLIFLTDCFFKTCCMDFYSS